MGGVGRSIREVPGGFLLFSGQREPVYPYLGSSYVRMLDPLDGSLIGELMYASDSLHQNYGYIDPVDDHPGGGFISVITEWMGYQHRLAIYRFDNNGDTLWTRELMRREQSDSIVAFARDIEVLSDGSYLLGGAYSYPDATSLSYLIRADANGDTLWTRKYPNNIALEVLGVEQYHDGGFVLTGYRIGNTNVVFLMRTDANGDPIWVRYMGNKGGSNAAVRMLADSSIVSWCGYREPGWPNDHCQFMLTKWDSAGNIIWQKRSHYALYVATFDFEQLADGGFIATGCQSINAVLQRFDANGDSLWSRNYQWFLHNNFLYDVQPTSDGGFIATGYGVQTATDPTPGLQTIIVLKTDSFGCVVPGCHTVGVQEYELSLHEQLRIWPNPVAEGGTVQVQLELPEGYPITGQVRLVVMDALGRGVREERVVKNGNTLSHAFTLAPHSPGLYFLHLADEKKWLAGGKVVVSEP